MQFVFMLLRTLFWAAVGCVPALALRYGLKKQYTMMQAFKLNALITFFYIFISVPMKIFLNIDVGFGAPILAYMIAGPILHPGYWTERLKKIKRRRPR